MTDVAGPFDGSPWAEAQWYRHAPMWAPSGVYGPAGASTSTGGLPFATSGLQVSIGAGRANVRGAGFERTGTPPLQAVTTNGNASLSRRDRVVLRRNLATHTVTVVVIAGTPSASPTAPTVTQVETGSWDLPLFSFLVPPNNGTSITGVIDERVWLDDNGQLVVHAPGEGDATGRAPITVTTKVASGSALTGVITVPAANVPYRLVATAMGRTGFDDTARQVAWDFDSLPGGATSVAQDDNATKVYAPDSQFTALNTTLSMEVPAGTDATFRLVLRSDGPVYSRGAVVWHRSRII